MAKLRVLKAKVIDGGSASGLEEALNDFYLAQKDSDAELLEMLRVADYAVLITYTGQIAG